MKFDLRIFRDLEQLSHAAAWLLIEQAGRALRRRGRFLLVFSGGDTPARLFQLLASDYRTQVDWRRTHIFWSDERCVAPDAPDSNYGLARRLLLSHVDIPNENVHRIRADLGPAQASREYALTLRRFAAPPLDWPRFDLVLLGLGADGHTASLFPESPIGGSAPVLVVSAHYRDRPAQRVTLTPAALNTARLVAFLVAGDSKAEALARALNDGSNPEQVPARRIRPAGGKVVWLVDEEAARKLERL